MPAYRAAVEAGADFIEVDVRTTADGKLAGNLLSNPLTAAERLDAATKELAARQAVADQSAAAAKLSQALGGDPP